MTDTATSNHSDTSTSNPMEDNTLEPLIVKHNGADMRRVFALQQVKALALRTSTSAERIAKIEQLCAAVLKRRDEIYAAMRADFNKPEAEVDLGEIMVVKQEAKDAIRHLKSWMKPQRVSANKMLLGTFNHVRYEPKGVCLIIAPWNFPVNLLIGPLISCLAAGNTAMLKPSEMTPATSRLMQEIIEGLFDESEVAVFQGAAETSQALLELKFDHCFFTGSPAVGKIVMAACAKHLTSVTLELGGKSPVVVEQSANLKDAAGSLAFGKCNNAGQACIAPDYALVEQAVRDEFVRELVKVIEQRYGDTLAKQQQTPDLARIINQRHTQRIADLIDDAVNKGATLAYGGDVDVDACWIQPCILLDVPPDADIMEEEVFGPVLPVQSWTTLSAAVGEINRREKPLALYVYSKDKDVIDQVINNTSSGDAAINTCMVHFLNGNLPFGGANNSGIGKAHGFHGFKSFSHERSVVRDRFAATQLTAAPYNRFTRWFIKFVIRWMA